MAQRKTDHIPTGIEQRRLEFQTGGEAKFLPAMPITVSYSPGPVTVKCEDADGEIVFSIKSPGPLVGRLGLSAYALRTAFLNVKNPTDAVDFFLLFGPFLYGGNYDQITPVTKISHDPFTWSDFQGWQELIRIKMEKGRIPRKVLQELPRRRYSHEFDIPDHLNKLLEDSADVGRTFTGLWPDGLVFTFDKPISDPTRSMRAEIYVNSSLEAIIAACYIDTLIGVQYVLCAGQDCNNLFQIKSNHARTYCSQACAHKASVRRKRAEQKAKASPSPKKIVRNTSSKGRV